MRSREDKALLAAAPASLCGHLPHSGAVRFEELFRVVKSQISNARTLTHAFWTTLRCGGGTTLGPVKAAG